jgi:hypothetical protein
MIFFVLFKETENKKKRDKKNHATRQKKKGVFSFG